MNIGIGTTLAIGALALAIGPALAQADADGARESREAGALTLASHVTEVPGIGSYEWESGVLVVPQNRENPGGPVFELAFHRFPALAGADPATPPIFHLNGGPGWPGLQRQPEQAEWLERNVLPRTRVADLVFVGQRGIGTSAPNTVCRGPRPPRADEPYDGEARLDSLVEAARACRERWEGEGVDLSGITVVEAARDVRDVAAALGYGRIQLFGGSFGSHWGMTVLRDHPDLVARAVLTGMEGPDHTYDMPGWILMALERMAADAEASGIFDGRLPEGGLLAGFRRTIERASEAPIRVPVLRRGGRDTLHVDLGPADIRGLWGGFSNPSGEGHRVRGWAADMIRIAEGDLADAADAVLRRRVGTSQLPTAAFFMLDCGSGISGVRLERLLSDPGAEVVGPLGAFYEAICPVWDADLGEDFRAGFVTDIPTVIVHGDWDLSTPLENALELRPSFRSHRFVLVKRGTHGALGEALAHSSEFRDGLTRFLATGDWSDVPETVTLSAVEWVPAPER